MRKSELKTPVYLVNEKRLRQNLEILQGVQQRTGCRILLAQKAFSMYRVYPLIGSYLCGATASGLFEARLAWEEMWPEASVPSAAVRDAKMQASRDPSEAEKQYLPGKERRSKPVCLPNTSGRRRPENHVYSPAYTREEMEELCRICDHISFNSLTQLETHRPVWEAAGVSVGLRINPEYSTQEGHAIYDPCAPGSRLGVRKDQLFGSWPDGVEGLHFHTLCEQDAKPLIETFREVERKFGCYFPSLKWINLGGGHHITREGYDVEALEALIHYITDRYHLTVYLEPGEAVALNAGSLLTEVMDKVESEIPILILDTSAACHMPDVLEMPYRPPLKDSGLPGEKKYTVRLGSRTCLAGDIIGDYSFDALPEIGERLEFQDMAIYSMVKNNTFNGMPLPDIALERENGVCEVVKHFTYQNFKERLS